MWPSVGKKIKTTKTRIIRFGEKKFAKRNQNLFDQKPKLVCNSPEVRKLRAEHLDQVGLRL